MCRWCHKKCIIYFHSKYRPQAKQKIDLKTWLCSDIFCWYSKEQSQQVPLTFLFAKWYFWFRVTLFRAMENNFDKMSLPSYQAFKNCYRLFVRNADTTQTGEKFAISVIHFWRKNMALYFMFFSCLIWFYTSHQQSENSVIKGRVFLGWTSTKLGLMFLLKDTTQWRKWGSNPLYFMWEILNQIWFIYKEASKFQMVIVALCRLVFDWVGQDVWFFFKTL